MLHYLGKKGKMIHLLNEKRKIGIAEKPRKKYKAFMPAEDDGKVVQLASSLVPPTVI